MRKVAIEDLDPATYDEELHSDRKDLTEPLNTANVAIVRYALDPGERFSGSLHTHMDQEEVFLVVEGTATFETTADDETEDGPTEVVVAAGEAIRFAAGEFQTGRNTGEEPVVAFALGAPRESKDVRISKIPVLNDQDVSCPECGRGDMRITGDDDSDADFICPDCDETLAVS